MVPASELGQGRVGRRQRLTQRSRSAVWSWRGLLGLGLICWTDRPASQKTAIGKRNRTGPSELNGPAHPPPRYTQQKRARCRLSLHGLELSPRGRQLGYPIPDRMQALFDLTYAATDSRAGGSGHLAGVLPMKQPSGVCGVEGEKAGGLQCGVSCPILGGVSAAARVFSPDSQPSAAAYSASGS